MTKQLALFILEEERHLYLVRQAQNPHGDDHSIFIAFAPKENPTIAIAVYIENGGFGSTWAAPIASLMIEKYLRRAITNKAQEAFILNGNLTIKE